MQRILRLLADPTRLRILAALEREELAVGEIAEVLGMGQSRVSNHLRLLREAGALADRREGSWTFYKQTLGDDPRHGALWAAVREGLRDDEGLRADADRLAAVLDRRRSRSRLHFGRPDGDGAEASLDSGSLREEILAAAAPVDWTVVDAGCGDGFLTEVLAERFDRVVAIDHSPERLRAARARVRGSAVEFHEGEVDALPLDDASADAVFLSMVLHHVPEIVAALTEARRVLRPGGGLVIADLAPHGEEWMREAMGDFRLGIDAKDLRRALQKSGFTAVRVRGARDRLKLRGRRALDLFVASAIRKREKGSKRR